MKHRKIKKNLEGRRKAYDESARKITDYQKENKSRPGSLSGRK